MNKFYISFIEKSIKLHENKYVYSYVEYKNARTKVNILCPEHGLFEQEPYVHLKGHGCPICNGGVKYTQEIFLEKSKLKHGDKYDYSLINYINSSTKVGIVCNIHGKFEQKPSEHLKYGCFKCAIINRSNSRKLTKEDFVNRANKIHNFKYDYNNSNYISHKEMVSIVCKKHGEFSQRANSHLNGAGCPVCKESRGERKIKNFLSNNKINFIQQKKFKECYNISELPFDFYLPDYNICIEYDGIQHYKGWNNDVDGLSKIKINDKIKNEYCSILGNPKLLRISFKEEKNINSILENELL
jgi:hypothetical protein